MQPLPIDPYLPQIVKTLREHRAVVVVAEPGAGKTTRVPPGIIRAGILSAEHPNLVLLQPRRVAARAAAGRIAEENRWSVGREVGYQIRFEKRLTHATRLRVLTEGILNRQIVDDPSLPGIGAVVLDEFHERSLHTDLAIAMLKEVRGSLRDDLMLVVMSATLEAEPVAKYLGDCPIVRVPGRTFPIEIEHRAPRGPLTAWTIPGEIAGVLEEELTAEDAEGRRGGDSRFEISDSKSSLRSSASSAVRRSGGGDVLIFLPGADEIRRTSREIGGMAEQRNWVVLPLHGSLPGDHQLRALAPAPAGKRKIILATNIAETSLTIDGVTTVIDTGLARLPMYDAQRGLDRLDLVQISKASATQRAGRAGRTAPGRCIRLWSAKQQHELRDFEDPEIRRVDLAQTVLALHEFGYADPAKLPWFEPPPPATVAAAQKLLHLLGAVEAEHGGRITPLGRRMLALPVHPRLARLLIAAADAGMLEEGAALAAILSEKDFMTEGVGVPRSQRQPKLAGESDLLVRLEKLSGFARSGSEGIDSVAMQQVLRTRDQLLRIGQHLSSVGFAVRTRESRGSHSEPCKDWETELRRALLAAYPDRVVKRRASDPGAGLMVGGVGVRLAAESVVRRHELYLAIDLRFDQRAERREALVRLASAIEEDWLAEMFPGAVTRGTATVFDESRKRVVGRVETLYHDLPLAQQDDAPVEPAAAGRALAAALVPRAAELINADEAGAGLLARIAFARRFMPEHPWPDFTQPAALAEVLAAACRGKRTVEQIRSGDLLAAIGEQLAFPLDRLLDEHAPTAIAVPTGNRVRLDYTAARAGERPVLAVRLQEMFGLAQTPRVARGRVAVVLHLLSPNQRPVQVTDDLASFWKNTYPQVRKDLRARYPKHSWPEDPMTAEPTARAKRRT